MKKKLSIIIPVYNAEKYIKECLDSILLENRNNEIEVIVVNDGSEDKSSEIYNKYVDKEIVVYENSNKGVSYTRNFGIKQASGEYIMFVDADDKLSNGWFEKIADSMNENYDIVYFSNKIPESLNNNEIIKYIIGDNDKKICISAPFSKIFKRSFLLKNNIFFKENIINGEDMLFNAEALLSSKNIKIVNYSFYLYRANTGSATKRFDKRIVNSDKEFHRYLNDILNSSSLENEFKEKLKMFCKINGIITIMNRISFIKKYQNAKEEFTFIHNSPYAEIINDTYSIKSYKEKKLLLLCKNNKLYWIYIIMKVKNNLIKILRKNNEFIKI